MYKGVLLLLLCALSFVLSKHMILKRPSKQGAAKRYCGDVLTEALGLICNNNYYGNQNEAKRSTSEDDDDLEPDLNGILREWNNDYLPFKSRSTVFGAMLRHRRTQDQYDGIVYECCRRKGCTLDELRSYCAAD